MRFACTALGALSCRTAQTSPQDDRTGKPTHSHTTHTYTHSNWYWYTPIAAAAAAVDKVVDGGSRTSMLLVCWRCSEVYKRFGCKTGRRCGGAKLRGSRHEASGVSESVRGIRAIFFFLFLRRGFFLTLSAVWQSSSQSVKLDLHLVCGYRAEMQSGRGVKEWDYAAGRTRTFWRQYLLHCFSTPACLRGACVQRCSEAVS